MRAITCAVWGAMLLGRGSGARACLNDTRTDLAEREFRSRYERPATGAGPRQALLMGMNGYGLAVAMGGTALVATGCVRQFRRRREG